MEDRAVRERLVHQGVGTLSDAELVSIVIREGGSGVSAVGLSEKVLGVCGGVAGLSKAEFRTLRMSEGLGVAKAAALTAAMELGRRAAREHADGPTVINTNEDVVNIFRNHIAALPHEEFWVLYLSSANTVVGKEKVSQGGVSGTFVDHRLVVKRAIELLASGMILVHNHPSGIAKPSGDDLALTTRIAEAASLFDIRVVDHLVITAGECFSFRQAGMVK